jgi:hypothetical protein
MKKKVFGLFLVIVSVLVVNLVSKTVLAQVQFPCTAASDCVAFDSNPCRQFQCVNGQCVATGTDLTKPGCGACGSDPTCVNTNGVCDLSAEANCAGTGQDCAGILTSRCDVGCSGKINDFCCNSTQCSGNPADPNFDIDCACCGDGLTNQPGETCDGTTVVDPTKPFPPGVSCRAPGTDGQCTFCWDGVINDSEQCDRLANPNGCQVDQVCNTSCQCASACGDGVVDATLGEQCEPPNTATCDASCHTVCVVEGAGCNDSGPNICSILSPEILDTVHPIAMGQWIGSFLLPGGLFAAMRLRRRK